LDDTVRDQVDDRIIFETPNEKTCMVDL